MTNLGIFHRLRIRLFGERTARLRESTPTAHALSYLLVTVQSAAVGSPWATNNFNSSSAGTPPSP